MERVSLFNNHSEIQMVKFKKSGCSKKHLQANLNKNCTIVDDKRYRKKYRCFRRKFDKLGNRSPTKSNLLQLKDWTKHMRACNDGESKMILKNKHSYDIESLPDLPSEIKF